MLKFSHKNVFFPQCYSTRLGPRICLTVTLMFQEINPEISTHCVRLRRPNPPFQNRDDKITRLRTGVGVGVGLNNDVGMTYGGGGGGRLK